MKSTCFRVAGFLKKFRTCWKTLQNELPQSSEILTGFKVLQKYHKYGKRENNTASGGVTGVAAHHPCPLKQIKGELGSLDNWKRLKSIQN